MQHYNEERLHATLGYMTPATGIGANRMRFERNAHGESLRTAPPENDQSAAF